MADTITAQTSRGWRRRRSYDARDRIIAAARRGTHACRICGYQPDRPTAELTIGPVQYWCPDDGWQIGHLCRPCADYAVADLPNDEDYAVAMGKGTDIDDSGTDEDATEAVA